MAVGRQGWNFETRERWLESTRREASSHVRGRAASRSMAWRIARTLAAAPFENAMKVLPGDTRSVFPFGSDLDQLRPIAPSRDENHTRMTLVTVECMLVTPGPASERRRRQ